MNEDALRAMIREVIARQSGGLDPRADNPEAAPAQRLALAAHASHFRYALPDSGGACLIEPTVQCNHCGYCQSHGH
jgi:hypothetical protein